MAIARIGCVLALSLAWTGCSGTVTSSETLPSGAGGSGQGGAAGKGGAAGTGGAGGTVSPSDAGPDAPADAGPEAGLCPAAAGEGAQLSTNLAAMGLKVISEEGFVVYKGVSDSEPSWQVVGFGLQSTAQQLRISYPASGPIDIPVYVDQKVHLYLLEDQIWWTDRSIVIWDATGVPVFFFLDGSRPASQSWMTCGGTLPCPTATQAPTTCPSIEGNCGKFVYPPVELLAHGGLSSGEIPVALLPGESHDGFSNYKYSLLKSYHVVEMKCDDYPDDWMQVIVSQPACSPEKIGFTQQNTQSFDLFQVCVQADASFDLASLKAIDSTVICQTGPAAECGAGATGWCAGPLEYEPSTKVISSDKWSKLCALSAREAVVKIVGLHYE